MAIVPRKCALIASRSEVWNRHHTRQFLVASDARILIDSDSNTVVTSIATIAFGKPFS
jgi:hypothetical protein